MCYPIQMLHKADVTKLMEVIGNEMRFKEWLESLIIE